MLSGRKKKLDIWKTPSGSSEEVAWIRNSATTWELKIRSESSSDVDYSFVLRGKIYAAY